jgi:hypothetical protein
MMAAAPQLPVALATCALAAVALSAQQVNAASPRDSAWTYIVGTEETVPIVVRFGRPIGPGRSVLEEHARSQAPWSPGSGDPTTVSCTSPFMIGDIKLAAGTYSLWALPDTSGVTLIVNRRVGPGFTSYDAAADEGRARLAVEPVDPPVQPLSIYFRTLRKGPDTLIAQYDLKLSQASNKEHSTIGLRTGNVQLLVITWDTFHWSLPVKLQD